MQSIIKLSGHTVAQERDHGDIFLLVPTSCNSLRPYTYLDKVPGGRERREGIFESLWNYTTTLSPPARAGNAE